MSIGSLHSSRQSIIDAIARRDTSIIHLNLHISKTRSLVNYKLLVVRHRDLGGAANADRNEVVDPPADEECADGPDPGAESQARGDEEDGCEDEDGGADPEGCEAEGDDGREGDDAEAERCEDGDWDGGEGGLRCEEGLERKVNVELYMSKEG